MENEIKNMEVNYELNYQLEGYGIAALRKIWIVAFFQMPVKFCTLSKLTCRYVFVIKLKHVPVNQ